MQSDSAIAPGVIQSVMSDQWDQAAPVLQIVDDDDDDSSSTDDDDDDDDDGSVTPYTWDLPDHFPPPVVPDAADAGARRSTT